MSVKCQLCLGNELSGNPQKKIVGLCKQYRSIAQPHVRWTKSVQTTIRDPSMCPHQLDPRRITSTTYARRVGARGWVPDASPTTPTMLAPNATASTTSARGFDSTKIPCVAPARFHPPPRRVRVDAKPRVIDDGSRAGHRSEQSLSRALGG